MPTKRKKTKTFLQMLGTDVKKAEEKLKKQEEKKKQRLTKSVKAGETSRFMHHLYVTIALSQEDCQANLHGY